MSFYRTFIAAVAAMGLATSVFAADEAATSTTASSTANASQLTVAQADTTATQDQGTTTDQTKVNVNTATAKDLMKVKGLNGAKAKAIIAYRKKHGDFKTLDELKDVKGFKKMSDKTMKQVQDQLTIG